MNIKIIAVFMVVLMVLGIGATVIYGQNQVKENLKQADAMHAEQAVLKEELKKMQLTDIDGMLNKTLEIKAAAESEGKYLKQADTIFASTKQHEYIKISQELVASNLRLYVTGAEVFNLIKDGEDQKALSVSNTMETQFKISSELATKKDQLSMSGV